MIVSLAFIEFRCTELLSLGGIHLRVSNLKFLIVSPHVCIRIEKQRFHRWGSLAAQSSGGGFGC
jgi:hypothetical protein